jgi:hypothetical protein
MSEIPTKPHGNDAQSRFFIWVWECLTGTNACPLTLIAGPGQRVNRKTKGQYLVITEGAKSLSPPSTRQGPFQIDSVQDDFLTCFPYDNSTQARVPNGLPVYIAKEDKHQTDLTSEKIFGVVHNYTYVTGVTPPAGLAATDVYNFFRMDSVTGEWQLLTPPWLTGATGDIIYADVTPGLAIDGPNNIPLTLLISGRSAQWARVTQ